jgi:hypothetical protein
MKAVWSKVKECMIPLLIAGADINAKDAVIFLILIIKFIHVNVLNYHILKEWAFSSYVHYYRSKQPASDVSP